LFTPAEATHYLAARHGVHLCPETLRRYSDDGKVAAFRTASGRRLFPRDELDRLARDRATKAVRT
jgi:predicted site-specific integrase-resolvase